VSQIGRQRAFYVGPSDSHLYFNAGPAEPLDPRTGHMRIRIDDADHYSAHPGGYQSIRARRRAAVMGAGFEGDVHGGPPGRGSGQLEGHGFGVRASRWLRGAQSDGLVTFGDDH
jgi:hypothetical protein